MSCRSEGLIEIKARTLTEALGNKASLVSLYGAISSALHLENPSRTNGSAPCRQVCKLPGAILRMGLYLFFCCLGPLRHIRAQQGLPVRIGLRTKRSHK